jgi:hypothetical protein
MQNTPRVRAMRALAALTVFAVFAATASAQSPDSAKTSEKKFNATLVEANNPRHATAQLSRPTAAQVEALIARAKAAENNGQFRIAADDLAIAAVAAPSFAQRDTLHSYLRALLLQAGRLGGPPQPSRDSLALDSLVAQTLDNAFQRTFDYTFPVTRAAPASSDRIVLAEYITGTQCGICWIHDRAYAAVLRRYPRTDVIVLAYHGGPGHPVVSGRDSLWEYVTLSDASNSPVNGLYHEPGDARLFTSVGFVDGTYVGVSVADPEAGYTAHNIAAGQYTVLAQKIDEHLQRPPGARLAVTVTPSGVTPTSIAAIKVQVHVTPLELRKRLGVRLVLVEDTVRVTGFTNRRLQYAAVRTVAWSAPGDLFFHLPPESLQLSTVNYTFDVAALQQALLRTRETDEEARNAFPDARTWYLHPQQLAVVAIVQDLDTREVLQADYQRVFPPSP